MTNQGLSENGFNEMLDMFNELSPVRLKLPASYYDVRKLIKKLGLGYERIDDCPEDCMLYYGEHKDKTVCPVCNTPRYVDKKRSSSGKNVARKVLRYFPITSRLKRLYMSTKTAEHMVWHNTRATVVGELRHPADGEEWKNFDLTYPSFAEEKRNVRLGLAIDGFNPFANKVYSCWHVKFWNEDPAYQKRVANNRVARSKLRIKHTGGSVPFKEHYMKLTITLGREPTILEWFSHCHRTKGGIGPWSAPECENLVNRYESFLSSMDAAEPTHPSEPSLSDSTPSNAILSGSNPSDFPSDPPSSGPTPSQLNQRAQMEAWIQVSGGRKRNQVPGFGGRMRASEICPLGDNSSTSTSTAATQSGSGPSMDEEMMNCMVDKVNEKFRDDGFRDDIRFGLCEFLFGTTSDIPPDPDTARQQLKEKMHAEIREVVTREFARMLTQMHMNSLQGGSPFGMPPPPPPTSGAGSVSGSPNASGTGTRGQPSTPPS